MIRAHVRRAQTDRIAHGLALRRAEVWLKGGPHCRLSYASLQYGDPETLFGKLSLLWHWKKKSLILISPSNDSTSNRKHGDIETASACRRQDKPCSGRKNSDINQFDPPWYETVKTNLFQMKWLNTKLPWFASLSLSSSSSPSSSSTWQDRNDALYTTQKQAQARVC